MLDSDDLKLLKKYAEGDESAFKVLVERFLNLVYSTALRQVSNPSHAEEITQAVFIILAAKAKSISSSVILSGWLYQTTRLTASNFLRAQIRRQKYEQEAYMESLLNDNHPEAWKEIEPLLDAAMGELSQIERDVILLRYFEDKSASEIGDALRISAPNAQKRLTRAVEHLRSCLKKQGVAHSAGVITGAISSHSVQVAPAGLATTVAAMALAKGSIAMASTLTLVKGTLKLMTLAKIKSAIIIGAIIIFAAGVTAIAVDDSLWDFSSYNLDKTAPGIVIIRPTHFDGGNQGGVASMVGKIGGRNTSFLNVICSAYNISGPRILFNTPMPEGRFDYAVTTTNQPEDKLQAEIKNQFGLVAHREVRETEVLLLTTNLNNSSKMKLSVAVDGFFGVSPSQLIFTNQPISLLRDYLEGWAYRIPVLDKTGLIGRYDFVLDWPKPMGYVGVKGQETLKESLINELGLELVPGHEPVEMLVVEKTPGANEKGRQNDKWRMRLNDGH